MKSLRRKTKHEPATAGLTNSEAKLFQKAQKLYPTLPESAAELRQQFHCSKATAENVYNKLAGTKPAPETPKMGTPPEFLQVGDNSHRWAVIDLNDVRLFTQKSAALAAVEKARRYKSHTDGLEHYQGYFVAVELFNLENHNSTRNSKRR